MNIFEEFSKILGTPPAPPPPASRQIEYAKAVGVDRGFKLAQQTFARWLDETIQRTETFDNPERLRIEMKVLLTRFHNAKHVRR